MASKAVFKGTLRDHEDAHRALDVEFGYASRTPEKLIYFRIEGQTVTLKEEAGREFLAKMRNLALQMGF